MASMMLRMHGDVRRRYEKKFRTVFIVVDFAVGAGWYGCR